MPPLDVYVEFHWFCCVVTLEYLHPLCIFSIPVCRISGVISLSRLYFGFHSEVPHHIWSWLSSRPRPGEECDIRERQRRRGGKEWIARSCRLSQEPPKIYCSGRKTAERYFMFPPHVSFLLFSLCRKLTHTCGNVVLSYMFKYAAVLF